MTFKNYVKLYQNNNKQIGFLDSRREQYKTMEYIIRNKIMQLSAHQSKFCKLISMI